MAAAPSDANYVAFTDNQTATLSRDGGRTWEDLLHDYADPFVEVAAGSRPSRRTHRIRSRGAQVIVPTEAAVDPFDPAAIFITYVDLALRISRDNGGSWEHPTQGIRPDRRGQQLAYSIVCDPAVKGKAWAACGNAGRVYVTEDSGRTFRPAGIAPLLEDGAKQASSYATRQLALDPSSPPDRRVLYAATDRGLFKTANGGNTWESLAWHTGTWKFKELLVHPKNPAILYASPFRKGPDSGLYRSRDGGRTWVKLAPDKLGALAALSICREYPETLYAISGKPGDEVRIWQGARKLWRTDDGGDTWRLLDERRGAAVGVHPRDPNYVYYGFFAADLNTEPVGLVRSRDGGRTWEDIAADIPLCAPARICFDAADPARFFLLDTFAVFEGRDSGAPAR